MSSDDGFEDSFERKCWRYFSGSTFDRRSLLSPKMLLHIFMISFSHKIVAVQPQTWFTRSNASAPCDELLLLWFFIHRTIIATEASAAKGERVRFCVFSFSFDQHAFLSKYDGENDAMRWNRNLNSISFPHSKSGVQVHWLSMTSMPNIVSHSENTFWRPAQWTSIQNDFCRYLLHLERVYDGADGIDTRPMPFTCYNDIHWQFCRVESFEIIWWWVWCFCFPCYKTILCVSIHCIPYIGRTINFIWCFYGHRANILFGQMSNDSMCENKKIRFQSNVCETYTSRHRDIETHRDWDERRRMYSRKQ